MKKKIFLLFIFLCLFGITTNVSATSKVWSDKDGLSSNIIYESNLAVSYPMKVVKADDAICDDISSFADSDNSDDYIFYYYHVGASNEPILYETKMDKQVTDSNGNTIFYPDLNDSIYSNFIYDLSHYTYPNGEVDGITPIVIADKSGNYKLEYIKVDDANNPEVSIKNWNNQTKYMNYLIETLNEKDSSLTYKQIEKIESNNQAIIKSPENNKLDAMGEPVAEQGEKDQQIVLHRGEKTHASTWKAQNGNTLKLLKKAYNMIKIVVPLLIILLSIVDYIKVFFMEDEKVYKQAFNKFIKRIVIGIALFLVPALIALILNLAGMKDVPVLNVFM